MHTALELLRPSYYYKALLVPLGGLLGLYLATTTREGALLLLLVGTVLSCLASSVNYLINEVADAPYDVHHPLKRQRPVASGKVAPSTVLRGAGFLLAVVIVASIALLPRAGATMIALLLASGMVYNLPPLRTKDRPVLDVLAEAFNFPVRLSLGYVLVAVRPTVPHGLVLLFLWLAGASVMVAKRIAELPVVGEKGPLYRRSLGWYDPRRLGLFYVLLSLATLAAFHGAARVLEPRLVWLLPAVAVFLVWLYRIARRPGSVLDQPHRIWKERRFVLYTLALTVVTVGLAFLVRGA